jgi:hypothetical protein
MIVLERTLPFILGSALLAGSFGGQSAASAAEIPHPAGHYHRLNPSGELNISRVGGSWKIELSGASPPMGEATSGDCSSVSIGSLKDNKIVADVVPFKDKNITVTAKDISRNPGKVVLFLKGRFAKVVEVDSDSFCGVGADLTGVYVKQN